MPAKAALTSVARWGTKIAGNAAGFGLLDDVADLYTHLMDTFTDGDRVFIFGFSRGAFTARVIAGLIHRCGVLKPEFASLIPYALDLYRPHRPVDGARDELDDVVARFRALFSRPCCVQFLGLWDTVKAFGVFWPKSLPHLRYNASVRVVRHAMALEEKRTMFTPTTWGGTDGDLRGTPARFIRPAMPPRFIEPSQKVKEVWFAGCHSDVGGGLRESAGSLYKHSLEWMAREAERHHLLIDEAALQQLLSAPAGPQRKVESLRGWWHCAEIALRLHLKNQYPPAWRRRLTVGLWRGRRLSDFHRAGGLKVHDSVPEALLVSLKSSDRKLHFLPERERTLPAKGEEG